VAFEAEVSVVVARGADGAVAPYPPAWNVHDRHILDTSVMPAPLDTPLVARAMSLATQVAEALDAVGVLCVEMFLTSGGHLLVNEIAPRPHNSGHLTIEACETSQFEQQVRALCGLPLGRTDMVRPAAMANLLGDLWGSGEPAWDRLLGFEPAANLHLYGKRSAAPGRKMGHVTVTDADPSQALARCLKARESLLTVAPQAKPSR
jgi:5-(carboxyamino)imidazole ribonucleotide synthase